MTTRTNRRALGRATTSLALAAALTGGAALGLSRTPRAAAPASAQDAARELSSAFRDAARRIGPSVVSIVSTRRARTSPASLQGELPEGLRGELRGSPLGEELFRFFHGQGQGGSRFAPESRGQGTGVVVDADGTIVTNSHVVAGAEEFEVTLQDGRKLPATLVGTDPETDLAALRVDAHDLQPAQLHEGEVEVGDWVIAVGTPFGLEHTVTAGIVSATGRHDLGIATFEDLIQTDAAINPGNSGGPLVDLDGTVVGINVAIRSGGGGSDGIGFAIPAHTVRSVIAQLDRTGRVERGWLGVSAQSLTEELASSFGYQGTQAVLVGGVVPGGPAQHAGLRAGDIVEKVGGKRVTSSLELRDTVAELAPGKSVELAIVRDGTPRTLSVELGTRPGNGESPSTPDARDDPERWGVALRALPDELAQQLEIEQGALIAQVEPGSPAQRAGLRAGEVLLSVDDQDVSGPEDAVRLLRGADRSRGVRLRVATEGGEHFLFLKE